MSATPNETVNKTLAQRLKGNMGKLLLSVLLLSIVVILLTITVTAQDQGKAENTTTKVTETEQITTTVTPLPEVKTTPKPPVVNVTWSADTLKTGNGSVFIDTGKVMVNFRMFEFKNEHWTFSKLLRFTQKKNSAIK